MARSRLDSQGETLPFLQIKIYETGGHGANILESHPELAELIKDFISG